MRFNVQSKALYAALSSVSKVINSKNAMTILNNFLFEVEDEHLKITASDMENTLSTSIPISAVEGSGDFCVDARRCVELFKELPELMIDFVIEDNLSVHIDYPGGVFNFVAIPGKEYPRKANDDEAETLSFNCPVSQIIDGIDHTLFAVGTDDLRPQMMGILLDLKEDGITFVATDTRKLVKYVNRISAPRVEGSFILPTKPANIIKNVFCKEEKIKITLDNKSASVETENFTFTFQLIKGNFPPYNNVIPKQNPYMLTVDRVSLINALRRVGVFVDPSHGLVKFRISPESLEMKAQDNNFCTSGRETLPCCFTGQQIVIGFSAPYLIDICSTLSTDNIIIRLSDPSRPGVFLPEEDKPDTELLMLLMPMTVGEF